MIDPRIPLAFGDEVDPLRAEINEQARLLGISAEKELALRAENERLKAELAEKEAEILKLNQMYPATAYTVEIEKQLAEVKKDAELWREREARIKSLRERGFLGSPLRGEPYKIDMKGK